MDIRKLEDLSHIEPGSLATVFGKRSVRYGELQRRVKESLADASWWDVWGEDVAVMLGSVVVALPLGLWLMGSANVVTFAVGAALLGFCHGMATVKVAHGFSHGSLGFGKRTTAFVRWFSTEFIGAFPVDVAVDAHVKVHHPHTNVIGLGDSSTWRAPVFGRLAYLGLAPLALPVITPVLGFMEIAQIASTKRTLQFVLAALGGYAAQWVLYVHVSGLSWAWAVVWCLGTRALFMPCYIHVNIFQHIGLSMYSPDNRPDRLTQMTYGVLNLSRHPILDLNFGHTIINCHVEHHLFPKLTDKLCLRVKPIVQQFCAEMGLPYFEKTYANRLLHFYNNYEELMVNAPPITSFVAVQ